MASRSPGTSGAARNDGGKSGKIRLSGRADLHLVLRSRTRDKKFTKLQKIDKRVWGKKKGSSFGTTAAASRGVFYELAAV
jgi:hypothetical protein